MGICATEKYLTEPPTYGEGMKYSGTAGCNNFFYTVKENGKDIRYVWRNPDSKKDDKKCKSKAGFPISQRKTCSAAKGEKEPSFERLQTMAHASFGGKRKRKSRRNKGKSHRKKSRHASKNA